MMLAPTWQKPIPQSCCSTFSTFMNKSHEHGNILRNYIKKWLCENVKLLQQLLGSMSHTATASLGSRWDFHRQMTLPK